MLAMEEISAASIPVLMMTPATKVDLNVETEWIDATTIGQLEQTGPLVSGPGARRDLSSGGIGPLPKLSNDQQSIVQKAKKFAMEQSIKMVLLKQTVAHQQQQAKTQQKHQAIILMCRVYVGSINFEVKEDTLRQAFLPFGPIRSISMSWDPLMQKHKGFAFVEYEIPEAAQLALEQMNGVIICSRNIKVGRSSNMPQAQVVIDEITAEAKNYNRIYIASIHPDLTQDDIKSVFEAFGKITSCELAQSTTPGRHKGYCYIEYETSQAVADAIGSMNLFDLGGQYLRVGRAITPPDTKNTGPPLYSMQSMPTAAAVAAAAATAKIQAIDAVATNLGLNSDILAAKDPSKAAATQNNSSISSKFGPPPASSLPPPGILQFGGSNTDANIGIPGVANVGPPGIASIGAPGVANIGMPGMANIGPPGVANIGMPGLANIGPPGVANIGMPGLANMGPPGIAQIGMPTGVPSPAAEALALAQQKEQEELHRKIMDVQEVSTLQQQENISIKGQSARHLVMQKLMRTQTESVVVLLKNMVTADEVDDELQEEVQEECSKFGSVERVIIYNEKQSEDDDAEVIVKIFVEFKDSKSAKACKDSLHSRFFGGRIISAEIYDQDLYDHSDFSG